MSKGNILACAVLASSLHVPQWGSLVVLRADTHGAPARRSREPLQRVAPAPPSVVPPGSAECTPARLLFSNNTPVTITDVTTITSTITVSGVGTYLWDLDLTTEITHTFPGDLDITLTPPIGFPVTITTDNGGSADNVFNGTVRDDQAGVPVTDHVFFDGVVAVSLVPEGALNALHGQDPNGTWTLTITDDAGGDTGMLISWSLSVSTCQQGFPPLSLTASNFTNSAAALIPDSGGGALTSQINVTGTGTRLHRLFLTTNITHTSSGDLDVTLTSPAGTIATITTGNGLANDDVFNGTMWHDDGGSGAAFVPVTDAVFTDKQTASDLVPEEAMAAFQGEDPNGLWMLSITDTAVLDTGTLTGWSLTVVADFPFQLTGLSPGSGTTAGGTTITLTGPGFDTCGDVCSITLGGVPATFAERVSSTAVTAVTPAHAAGFVDVTITDTLNNATLVNAFIYVSISGNPTDDADGDGMPDFWESRYGLDPLDPADANADPDGDGKTSLQEFLADTHPRGFFRRFFAEGAATTFFDTAFAVASLLPAPSAVLFRFLRADGTIVSHFVSVGASTRITVDAKTVLGAAPVEFSTVVEWDRPRVVADRTMMWDTGGGYGSHAERGIPAPATLWYLAEGATHSGFNLFYLIQNPNGASANVEVTYLLPGGVLPVVKNYTVPANRRFNIWVNDEAATLPQLASTDVSAVIRSTNLVTIIVERAMYLNSGGLMFGSGHESAGITTPGTTWFFAEGATGPFFDLFILIANPNGAPVQVEARYLLPNGTVIRRTYTVAANSRFNIWVDLEDPLLADQAVSTTLTSLNGVTFIAERAMWWPGSVSTWHEAHNSAGAAATSDCWGLADGELGGPRNTQTFILIANTAAVQASVDVELVFETGAAAPRTFSVAANSRFNIDVAAEFPAAAGRRFGASIGCGGVGPTLVVERAMYSDAFGIVWAAGTNALATPLP